MKGLSNLNEFNEKELSAEEWINYKSVNWDNAMKCQELDKRKVILFILKSITEVNKNIENIKLEMKGGLNEKRS